MKTKTRGRGRNLPVPILVLAVALVAVAALRLMGVGAAEARHPDPRPEITAQHVIPSEQYPAYPRIAAVYREAARIPQVLDGLYCYCDCSKHSAHRSLLTCFESDHGAGCDVCLSEATVAAEMTREGASLQAIREAIDGMYASAR
ncbi:MAG: hypothetical protein HY704_11490 [Gemmatimonadetes bacterium]|nr:hypothetical protein [Gemmatimonadota bacterium]